MLSKSKNSGFSCVATTIFMALWLIPILLVSFSAQLNGAVASSFLVLNTTKSAVDVPDKLVSTVDLTLPNALASSGYTVLRLDSTSPIYQRAKGKLDTTEQTRMDEAYNRVKSDTISINDKTTAAVYLGSILEMDTALTVDIYGMDRDPNRTYSRVMLTCTVMRAQTDATGKIVRKNGNITAYKTTYQASGRADRIGTGGYITDEALDIQALNNAMTDLLNQITASSTTNQSIPVGEYEVKSGGKKKGNNSILLIGGVVAAIAIAAAAGGGGGGGGGGGDVPPPPPVKPQVYSNSKQHSVNAGTSTGDVLVSLTTIPALANGDIIYVYRQDADAVLPSVKSENSKAFSDFYALSSTKTLIGRTGAVPSRNGFLMPTPGHNRLMKEIAKSKAPGAPQGDFVTQFNGSGSKTLFEYIDRGLSNGNYLYSFYDSEYNFTISDIVKVDSTNVEVRNVNAVGQYPSSRSVDITWNAPTLSTNVTGYKIYVLKGTIIPATGIPSTFKYSSYTNSQLTQFGFKLLATVPAGTLSYTHRLDYQDTNDIFIYVIKSVVSGKDSIGPYMASPYVLFPSNKDVVDPNVNLRRDGGGAPYMQLTWLPATYLLSLINDQSYLEEYFVYDIYYAEGPLDSNIIFNIEEMPWVILNPDSPVPYDSLRSTYSHTLDNIYSPFSLNTSNNYIIVGRDSGYGYPHLNSMPPYFITTYPISGPDQMSYVTAGIEDDNKLRVRWDLGYNMYVTGFDIYRKIVDRAHASDIPTSYTVSDLSDWYLRATVGPDARVYEDNLEGVGFLADRNYLYAIVPRYFDNPRLEYDPPYLWDDTGYIDPSSAQAINVRVAYNMADKNAKLDWAAPYNDALIRNYVVYRTIDLPIGTSSITQDQWDTLEAAGQLDYVGQYLNNVFTMTENIGGLMSTPGTIVSYIVRTENSEGLIDVGTNGRYQVAQAMSQITEWSVVVEKDSPKRLYYSSNPVNKTSDYATLQTRLQITAKMGAAAAAGQLITVSLPAGVRGYFPGADPDGSRTIVLNADGVGYVEYMADADVDDVTFTPATSESLATLRITVQQYGYLARIPLSVDDLSFVGEPRNIMISAAAPADKNYSTLYGAQPDTAYGMPLFSGDSATITGKVTDMKGNDVFQGTKIWVTQTYTKFANNAEARTRYTSIGDLTAHHQKVVGGGFVTNGICEINDKGEITTPTFASPYSGDYTIMAIPVLATANTTQLSNITSNNNGGATDTILNAQTNAFIKDGSVIRMGSVAIRNKTLVAADTWENLSGDAIISTSGQTTISMTAYDSDGKVVLPGVPYKVAPTKSDLTGADSVDIITGTTNGYMVFDIESKTGFTILAKGVVAWPNPDVADTSLKSAITRGVPAIVLNFTGSTATGATPNNARSLTNVTIYPYEQAYMTAVNQTRKWFGGTTNTTEFATIAYDTDASGKTIYYVSTSASNTNSTTAVTAGGVITLPNGQSVVVPNVPTSVEHTFAPTSNNVAKGIIVAVRFKSGATENINTMTSSGTLYGVTAIDGGNTVIKLFDQTVAKQYFNSGYNISSIDTITVDEDRDAVIAESINFTANHKDYYAALSANAAEKKVVYYGTADGNVIDNDVTSLFIPKDHEIVIGYGLTNTASGLHIPGQLVNISAVSYGGGLNADKVSVTGLSTYTSTKDNKDANYFIKVAPKGTSGTGTVQFGLSGYTGTDYTIHIGLPEFAPLTVTQPTSNVVDLGTGAVTAYGNALIQWNSIAYAGSYDVTVSNAVDTKTINVPNTDLSYTLNFDDTNWAVFTGTTCKVTVTAKVPAGYRNANGTAGTEGSHDAYFVAELTSTVEKDNAIVFPPKNPTSLGISLAGDNSLVYNWTKADGATNYYLMRGRSYDGGVNFTWDNPVAGGGLLGDVATYQDSIKSGSEGGVTHYCFKLLAYNAKGGYSSMGWIVCPTTEWTGL